MKKFTLKIFESLEIPVKSLCYQSIPSSTGYTFRNVTQTQFYDNAISSSIVISLMHDVSIDQNLDRNK